METRYCKQCGNSFNARRDDHYFCSAKCVAAWYRDNDNPDNIHAAKERVHTHYCEYCGVPFEVNDYAQRQGKREPKYCSNAHKQAAYRQRGQTPQPQAARRPKQEAPKQEAPKQEAPKQEAPKQAHSHPKDFWSGFVSRRSAALSWLDLPQLNVALGYSDEDYKKAWKKQMKRYHPDVCKEPDATWKAQAVNWAHAYLSGK